VRGGLVRRLLDKSPQFIAKQSVSEKESLFICDLLFAISYPSPALYVSHR